MDARSERNLAGVHPDLATLIRAVATQYEHEIIVTEGVRTPERQAELFKAGASLTLNSRHLTGHAIDVAVKVSGEIVWTWHIYAKLAEVVKQTAKELAIPIIWGGDFVMRDGVHYELPRNRYFEDRHDQKMVA